jgi:hypothetical protein
MNRAVDLGGRVTGGRSGFGGAVVMVLFTGEGQ